MKKYTFFLLFFIASIFISFQPAFSTDERLKPRVALVPLVNVGDDEQIDCASQVRLFCDGVERLLEPGQPFELQPGESVTLPPCVYHTFWAKTKGRTLVAGEVSTVSDASKDNRFGEAGRRFIEIEEDEPPIHLLSHEYP